MQGVAEIAVGEGRWDEALELLKRHADLAETVALPWARLLAMQGRQEEAYRAYR